MEELRNIVLSDVAGTSLITLYCHALESQSGTPILEDPRAVEIVDKLNPILSESPNMLYRKLTWGKIDKRLVVHVCMRARRYDEYVRDFLKRAVDGVVVNIGCGFDTRFHRVDDGKVEFYDLDLPEVIEIKKELLEETQRYHFIASSVLDFEWMRRLAKCEGRPMLLLAEGVFMYLHGEEVKALVLELQSRFAGCELVCEVINSRWLKKWLRWMVNLKLQRQLKLGKDATFNFGLRDGREMEKWGEGIEFLDEWSYFDEDEPRLGWLKLFRHFELLRRTQWTLHYRLS